jgi:hypothetical protein
VLRFSQTDVLVLVLVLSEAVLVLDQESHSPIGSVESKL